jgi:murein DD-endopeptidase MepM/ murein hydrolase activator NlpD
MRWGLDADGDGVANPWDPEDAVFAAARYLAAAGAHDDLSRAIFAYNHAQWYVDDVLQLAAMFGGDLAGADAVFSLDRMAIALEDAQEQVATLSEQLETAESAEADAAAKSEHLAGTADDLTLLVSDRVVAEQGAFQAGQELVARSAETERLRTELEQAQAALEAAQSGAHAVSFAPGGGPSVVSVGHFHHDYPAADIAASLGAPVYALADAIVLSVVDDGRCGTGLVLRTLDGLEWVYCHLSYRDPGLGDGSVVSAGQWVGLVGSTGHSTGPHLHLGLRPARYPQEMPWFQEFAGIAYMWQDTPTEPAARATPVFALAPPGEPDEDIVEFTLAGG